MYANVAISQARSFASIHYFKYGRKHNSSITEAGCRVKDTKMLLYLPTIHMITCL